MFENTIRSVTVLTIAITVALAMFATPVAAAPDNKPDWAPDGGDTGMPVEDIFDEFPGQGDDHFPDSVFDGGDKDGSDPVITK